MEYLVQALNNWKFEDEKTKEIKEGVTVYYIDNRPTNDDGKLGYFPIKVTASIEIRKDIQKVPGYYDLDFSMKPDAKGKPTLLLRSLSFSKEAKLY
jgi:hypothetical protein